MLGYILLAIFIWVMYNLVTRFILPIYITSKRMREQFRNIREQQSHQQNTPPPPTEKPEEKVGEYIDFEEVK